MKKCPKCNSKDVVLGHTRGFRVYMCDDCDHEWSIKK